MKDKDSARRVAEAMKPVAARVASRMAPEPEEDPDVVSLLDAADPVEAADTVATWFIDPVTRAQLKKLRTAYVQRVTQLFARALVSTDPQVAALGGQINGLRLGMGMLGHKEAK